MLTSPLKLATAVVALAFALALLSCGSDKSDQGGGNATGSVITTPPAKGDIDKFVWALAYEPTGLDPVRQWSDTNSVIGNLCEGLVQLTPDLKIVPNLATKVDTSDPLAIVYTLREGTTFWDGSPVTAEDVAYSINRNLDPDVGSYFSAFFRNVKSVETTDARHVRISLRRPDVLVAEVLAMGPGAISKKSFAEKAGADYGSQKTGLMCSGPFKLGSWRSGQSLTLIRNDSYWNTKLRPKARRVELRFVADDTARVNGLVSGDLQGTHYTPTAGIRQLRATKTGTYYPGRSTNVIDMIPFPGPLTNSKLRRAVSLAVDRAAIASVVYADAAEPARSLVSPAAFGYATSIFQKGYNASPVRPTPDLERAKALVAEAGKPDRPIVIASSKLLQFNQLATVIADDLKKIGLQVKIRTLPPNDYNALFFDTKLRKGIDLFFTGWWADVADPLLVWDAIGNPKGAGNYTAYDSPQVTKLLNEALAEPDHDARAQLINEVQKQMLADLTWIPLVNQQVPMYMNNEITGAAAALPAIYYYPWAVGVGKP